MASHELRPSIFIGEELGPVEPRHRHVHLEFISCTPSDNDTQGLRRPRSVEDKDFVFHFKSLQSEARAGCPCALVPRLFLAALPLRAR